MVRRGLTPRRRSLVISGLTVLGTAIVTGIIGNRADAGFVWMWGQFIYSSTEEKWSWFTAFICMLIAVTLLLAWQRDRRRAKLQVSKANLELSDLKLKLSKLDQVLEQRDFLLNTGDSLLRLLPRLIGTNDLDAEMHKIMQHLLSKTIQVFTSNIRRGLILLPDSKREYLFIWESGGWIAMDEESKAQKRFYVGPTKPGWQRGVAGEAFVKMDIIVAHIYKENNQYRSDRESFFFFKDKGSEPSYRSLVCVPIVTGLDDKDRLGVICFDSMSPTAFDSTEGKEMLLLLSRYVAATLRIYQVGHELRQKGRTP